MTDDGHVDRAMLLVLLDEVWESAPDLRFGQLIECITGGHGCIFYMKNSEFTKKIVEFGERSGAFVAPDEEE